MSSFTRFRHRSAGGESLVAVDVVVATTFTGDASDYWTFKVWHKRAGDVHNGRLVGTLSTAALTLVAGVGQSLYDDPVGEALDEGDELWTTIDSTGSPAVPDDPCFVVERHRTAR